MNHRPRRSMTVMTIVAVVVLFGVLAYVGSRRSNPPSGTHAASSTSSTASPSRSTSTPSTTSGQHAAQVTTPKKKTRPTPTTVPTQIVALSSTSTTAIYPVSTNSYRVTVTATGPVWVAATTVSTGSTLWAGTMQTGGVQQIMATGVTTVQLGTPAASLALNGVPVVFPTPERSPFVATFQPTTAASSGSSTTAPTSVPTTTPTTAPTRSTSG